MLKKYQDMTAEEKIEYNLQGIIKELEVKQFNLNCEFHKEFCIKCSLSEIRNALNIILNKQKDPYKIK